ncbi:MAG: ABC transporter ATP-binding protein [Myxococcaceae bacterium]
MVQREEALGSTSARAGAAGATLLLSVEGIRKEFGGVVALAGVEFEVRAGSISALIGPNGAGKTTCFNMISGVYKPTRGRIRFDRREVTGLRPDQIAALGIGRTFQVAEPFGDMSVLENVMVGCHVRGRAGLLASGFRLPSARREERAVRDRALEALDFVGLAPHADKLAGSLPLGQERLMEVARALAAKPKLLLLDESASGLGPRETEVLGELIRKIRGQGITVLLVEHNMHLVMGISDEVVVLHHGERIFAGTPAEAQSSRDVLDAYLGKKATAR